MTAQSDAALAAALFAVDPAGVGGVVLRARWGPTRDRWLTDLHAMLPADAPVRRIPPNVTDDRLLGGLDLAATLQTKRPVVERGVLADANGGVVVVSMAERLASSTVAHLTAALDLACVVVERDGVTARPPARLGLTLLDEGVADDEQVADALRDRLAFHVDLDDAARGEAVGSRRDASDIARARRDLADVACGDEIVTALCEVAMALGIASVRAPFLALKAARASAALHGRSRIEDIDAAIAARLVLAPRAIRLPTGEPPQEGDGHSDDTEAATADASDPKRDPLPATDEALLGMILDAAKAAMPTQILDSLRSSRAAASRLSAPGRAGVVAASKQRGRPAGTRPGEPRGRSRINIIETLRVAAPWQPLRRRVPQRTDTPVHRPDRIEIRREDFRVTRFKRYAATTTVFVVDASGSSAANRLAEAKGAVELLLADCYVRRDEVALISFRGSGAEVVLPPTRSLVRAKRCLAGLPGGGGTPLAAAIDMATLMAGSIVKKGRSPVVVLLTDGRANVTREGKPGVARAAEEATAASRAFRVLGVRTLIVDTSPRPQALAEQLAKDMAASYLPLPYASSGDLSRAIQAAV
jgi:magnesium chelatase subunit D